MALWHLLTYVLLTYSTGSRAKDTVFVMTGASVQLNIQTDKPDEFDDIAWKKDKLQNVVKYFSVSNEVRPHPSYNDRVEFNTESFSLTLRNMKKTDSGVYTATASGHNDTHMAEHRVSVIDAVEAPVLTVNSNSSTGLCNFTCNTNIFTIYSVINNSRSCSEEVTSSEIYHTSLRCIDDFIICNHSNPVSWKMDTKTIEPICIVRQDKRTATVISASLHWLIPIICISLGLFGTGVGVCFYKYKKGAQDYTVYEECEEKNKTQKSQEMLDIGSGNAHTVYDTANKQPDDSIQTTPTPDSTNQSKPETSKTIYCAIQKHSTPPASESDKTIYAVVNKHSTMCETVH
ncbi:uncharacterized protein [Paramisgurnus dabryanus]|uniref:uncharacterized protein isoform X2 n=1 Tax=Paramisgurnus dabryanus TaxID=90735 RepID=UPI0031F393E8